MREVFCFGVVVAKLWRRGGTEEEEGGKPAGYDGGGGGGEGREDNCIQTEGNQRRWC